MIDRVIDTIRQALPNIPVIPPNMRKRSYCVVYRFHPAFGQGKMGECRLDLRFVAPTLSQARNMYLDARRAILSDGDFAKVGEGVSSVLCDEIADGGGTGYIAKSGLYFVKAGFMCRGIIKDGD